METKFLNYLHVKLDSLISDDCLNIPDIQKKARYLAQFRFQDCNYNDYARSYLLSAIVKYDSFLIKKMADYVNSMVSR